MPTLELGEALRKLIHVAGADQVTLRGRGPVAASPSIHRTGEGHARSDSSRGHAVSKGIAGL